MAHYEDSIMQISSVDYKELITELKALREGQTELPNLREFYHAFLPVVSEHLPDNFDYTSGAKQIASLLAITEFTKYE